MIYALLALAMSADAATLYVNGTPVDGLRDFEFSNVTVQVDDNGDVFIIAPQYNVALGDDAKEKKSRKTKKDVTTPPESSGDGTVPGNRWWLFSEDNQTEGQVVDVAINDTIVKTFRSGGKQIIFDLGPYLNAGKNSVTFTSRSERLGGGALFLYVGTGSIDGGRVSLNKPEVELKRNASSEKNETVSATLTID
jgi:hypothetical protein